MEVSAKIVIHAVSLSVLLEKGRFFKVFRNLEVNYPQQSRGALGLQP
jgi:hypothetical protein